MNLIRKIRILIQHRNICRALFKIALGQKDASVYFFPYGPKGKYFYGRQSMKENEISQTFRFMDDFNTDNIPKLSIHQSGQIHIHDSQNAIAGPLQTIPLGKWKGEHIATVTADSFESLAIYTKDIITTGPEIDHVIPCDDAVTNGRIVVYCNGQSSNFNYPCRLTVQMQRPNLNECIYIGFAPISQNQLGNMSKGGVTVIAGWDPKKGINKNQDYLYIRAQ